jgi:hypothetical protein
MVEELRTRVAGEEIAWPIPRAQILKIKIEVDTDPPLGFITENKFILQPIPFSVKTFALPDLFAGKMHAVLCRQWKSRVKGRDWYDLVWYAANHPQRHLGSRSIPMHYDMVDYAEDMAALKEID